MYLLGEALIGEEPEIAHIDLIIGDKNGPIGAAFVNAMSHMSAGHTPLLAVIRPNLPTKPSTLVVPKVTVQNLEQAAQVFGPAQTAIAKAVADAVEEGLIPKGKAEDLVLIVSVFIHPEAEDYGKIYRYNYGATKLAIQRAMEGFPSVDKIMYEKDRSTHPIMGFKIAKLWDPPYLQVALDIPSLELTKKVLEELPESDHLILEAGTPLIKRYGLDIIQKMREIRRDAFIVADLKTLDVGNLEARMAADATADALVVSGLAPPATIEKVITEARKTGICSVIDMLNVGDPKGLLERLTIMPDVVELHRAIDVESKDIKHAWSDIKGIKLLSDKMLVAVAGGIMADNAKEAIKAGADILIVGRAITKAKDIEGMTRRFLELMKEEIDQFRVMTDF
ncbi:MAG: bifunctional 5,6,7,8-tetrahydromethanopterin hydro-lyase/3-hexulose-6-phosphate synthase [Methanocellales archaeon]|nr:bifunctional 5,6,7,8-tetrahydromethanopterin hydro-lyase/3-hexulose-6-phosphate synthase [Methanocellales archaeon]MDD5446492.1 bifunctional 5,6,7,8-tetrahydromethanopterin hydro-lyase/3-hexulose-6-phosphate synthase [Methanocellales archaeon]